MVNLHRLLDEDGLTPAQEREIRRLVKYELTRKDDKISFKFFINPKGIKPTKCLDVFSIKNLKKETFYRNVLIELINFYASITNDRDVINEVLAIIRTHNLELYNSMKVQTFYIRIADMHFELKDKEVKTKTLYNLFKILKKD